MLFWYIICHVLKRSILIMNSLNTRLRLSTLRAYWNRSFWTLSRQPYWVTHTRMNTFRDNIRRTRVWHVRNFNWNESIITDCFGESRVTLCALVKGGFRFRMKIFGCLSSLNVFIFSFCMSFLNCNWIGCVWSLIWWNTFVHYNDMYVFLEENSM